MLVPSPVTGGVATRCDAFTTEHLVNRYRNDWGLDVASHFAGVDRIFLYRCEDTGYRFFHPPSLAGEAAFYDKFWQLAEPTIHRPEGEARPDWEFALNQLRAGERFLDVGCADGAFLQLANDRFEGQGIDENAEGCRVAQSKGLRAEHAAVSDYAAAHEAQFDAVLSSQVLEHVYGICDFVRALIRLARPGGRLILSVPNNEPYFAGWSKYDPLNNPPHHIGLWNARSLQLMAEHFGLITEAVGYLGEPDRFALQCFRRAAHLGGITKAPNQLAIGDWIKVVLLTPAAIMLTSVARVTRPTSRYAFMSVVLRKPSNDSR